MFILQLNKQNETDFKKSIAAVQYEMMNHKIRVDMGNMTPRCRLYGICNLAGNPLLHPISTVVYFHNIRRFEH